MSLLRTLSIHLHRLEVSALGRRSFSSEAPGFLGMGRMFEIFHDLGVVVYGLKLLS